MMVCIDVHGNIVIEIIHRYKVFHIIVLLHGMGSFLCMISESKTLLISDYCVFYAHAVLIFIVIVMKTEQDVN